MNRRQRIEQGFARLGHAAHDKPYYFIALALLLLLFFVWQLQFLQMDTTTEGFLKKNDPDLVAFERFKQTFGRDEQFIVALESPHIFSHDFLRRLVQLHQALEQRVPYLAEVDSLYNVRDIYGADDELVVADLLEQLPQDAQQLQALRDKVLASELYRNSYISADGGLTTIYLRPEVYVREVDAQGEVSYHLLADREIQQMASAIREVLADGFQDLAERSYIAGSPAITDELSVYLVGDMARFILMALAVIAAVLFFLFRRLLSIVLPLLVMLLALLSTMGMMSLTGQPVQLPTVILPSFILAVGVCNAIHLLTIFFRHIKRGEDKRSALSGALAHVGLPLFFTSLTTAASLLSFGRSEILPVANLGLFAAVGVAFAFVYTIVLLPPLLAILPVQTAAEGRRAQPGRITWFERFLRFSVAFSARYSLAIVIGGLLLMAVAAYSAAQLRFSHDVVKWLPASSTGRLAIEHVGERIGGSVSMELVIDSGSQDGMRNADRLQTMAQLADDIAAYHTDILSVGKVMTPAAMIKETNRALFDNDPAQYRIPDDDALVAQEFLMLETSGARDLFRLVDSNYRLARMTVMTPWVDALHFGDFVRDIEAMASRAFAGIATVELTGIVPILAKTLRHMMMATAVSYVIAFAVISLMMIVLLGSVRYGLVSMIPNILPITVAMGLMQVTGAPLDMYSMLIGSIAIGLSVDDTVHFMHGFRRVYEKTGDAHRAIDETLHSSGRAMLSTTIVLSLGFLVYLFSGMNNLQDFGLYTTVCLVIALLADFWLAPALMLLMHRNKTQASSRH